MTATTAVMPAYSAGIINYEGGELVLETIASLKHMDPAPAEILVVDDGSRDGSVEAIRRRHPDVRVVALPFNTGRPTIVRNRVLSEARERYVLLTDNDIAFAPDAAAHLIEVMTVTPEAAVCRPLILVDGEPERVYAAGKKLHFTCWSTAEADLTASEFGAQGPFEAQGVGIMLVDKQAVLSVGGFDEGMVLGWGDDNELHYRLSLAGHSCLTVPTSHAFHARLRETHRVFGQVHNRLRMMMQSYERRTLLLLSPVLLAFELLLLATLTIRGHAGDYVRAVRTIANDLPAIRARRRLVQGTRRISDADLLCADTLDLPGLRDSSVVRRGFAPIQALLGAYWRAATPWISKTAVAGALLTGDDRPSVASP